MERENNKPADLSVRAKFFVDSYISSQTILLDPDSYKNLSEIGKKRLMGEHAKLEAAQTGIRQTVADLGSEGLTVFWGEAEKLEQKLEKERQEHEKEMRAKWGPSWRAVENLDYWSAAAKADPSPSMSEYYENEGRAASRREYQAIESPMSSLKRFLHQLQQEE